MIKKCKNTIEFTGNPDQDETPFMAFSIVSFKTVRCRPYLYKNMGYHQECFLIEDDECMYI